MKKKFTDFNYKYGFNVKDQPVFKTKKGLTRNIVEQISEYKKEPEFMRGIRLSAYDYYIKSKLPNFGVDLANLNFNDLTYFSTSTKKIFNSWQDLPENIKLTYDKIGVPRQERNFLAGVSAQFDSSIVYKSLAKQLTKQKIIFCDMDSAVVKYTALIKKYFGKLVPINDNIFASLNSAVWSGGSFLYIPAGVKVDLPLSAYFRINSASFGQFERTLIIADEGSSVHYTEGCTAPIYSTNSLHAAVVEIFALPGSHIRYTTVQNWSNNIYNLVTKRARAEKDATVEWVDVNIGSKVTMKYPAVILNGKNSRGSMLSIAYANAGQNQDSGARMIHLAPNTSSSIISKSISVNGGICSYRGAVIVDKKAKNSKNNTRCDALIADDKSVSNTYPNIKVGNKESNVEHEATVEKISEEKIYYLQSRGLTKNQAEGLIVNGFIEPVTKELPLEYSVELYRLMNMQVS